MNDDPNNPMENGLAFLVSLVVALAIVCASAVSVVWIIWG